MPFRLIMDNVPTPVFVKDEQFRIVFANKAFLDIYPPERRGRIIGHTTVEEFSEAEAEAFLREDRRAFDLGKTEMVEEIQTYTGEKRVLLTRKIAFDTPDGSRRLLGVCSDITELHERERSLAERNVVLQSFSALAAHDLRSPLASIVNALELIGRDVETKLSERSKTYLEMISDTARSLSDNIECLLLTNKAERRTSEIRFATCELNMALLEVKFRLSSAISRHQVLIYSSRLPTILAEASLMRQLLQNLIENSIKYREPKRQLVITLRHEETPDGHQFELEDNGRGMAKDVANRAFQIYEQDETKNCGGAGLGLALCKRVVEMHGGWIEIDPSFLVGCRIKWTLPLRSTEVPSASAA